MSADLTVPPPRLTDEQIYEAQDKARVAFRLSQLGPRGQMLTPADDPNTWFAQAVADARDAIWQERIAPLQAQRAELVEALEGAVRSIEKSTAGVPRIDWLPGARAILAKIK